MELDRLCKKGGIRIRRNKERNISYRYEVLASTYVTLQFQVVNE